MAGIFGDFINSRADFFAVLSQATGDAISVLKKRPGDPTLDAVKTQLEAIEEWTAHGRKPTPDERGKIAMGHRMYREFEHDSDEEIQRLRTEVTALQNYFRHWPDDAVASSPDNKEHVPLK